MTSTRRMFLAQAVVVAGASMLAADNEPGMFAEETVTSGWYGRPMRWA